MLRVVLLLAAGAAGPCGFGPTDWCPAPPGDACGRHRDEAACRADPRCEGMPYRGESAVACLSIGRGFSAHCPAVGCVSAPPGTDAGTEETAPFHR